MTNVRQIIINSPKYGQKICLVDSEDFEFVNCYKWFLVKGRHTFYASANKWSNNINRPFQMHRFIMKIYNDLTPKIIIDHKNGDALDNRKCNLRMCSNAENIRNAQISNNNTTGYKGVHMKKEHGRRKRYVAKIRTDVGEIGLGHFMSASEAAIAYNEAAIKYHGEFAFLNKV